jgi:multidrug efflux system outer membrane protein
MLRTWCLPLLGVAGLAPLVVGAPAAAQTAAPAPASSAPAASPAASGGGPTPAPDRGEWFGRYSEPTAPATIAPHRYTLAECLALADRNFPNLWAARARLAFTHAQLEEARWTPWFQWSAQSSFGVTPPFLGTVIYPESSLGPTTLANKNIVGLGNLQPFFGFGINGVLPVYTFGKIETAFQAAEANVRVSEWDMEKAHQQTRMDVRRAYFGLQLTRDVEYVIKDALDRLDKGIEGMKDKIARGKAGLTEPDLLNLQVSREETVAQSLDAPKQEAHALAGLRFLTGVETNFDIVDEPLKLPDRPLVSVAQYLEAARILRPDVNMARAGVVARKAMVEYNRARLFPDLGLGLGADFISTPNALPQQNGWAADPFNHFFYYFSFGLRWSLDLLPQQARVQQAESQLEETRALERLALANAEYEVEGDYADAVEAKTREETYARAEHLAKQWIADVDDAIDVGTMDERALVWPLRAYVSARVNHLRALMDYNVAMSVLAQASGWDSAAPTGS